MRHLKLITNDTIQDQPKCECTECGTTWYRGEMDDNETICFRCEYLIEQEENEDYE